MVTLPQLLGGECLFESAWFQTGPGTSDNPKWRRNSREVDWCGGWFSPRIPSDRRCIVVWLVRFSRTYGLPTWGNVGSSLFFQWKTSPWKGNLKKQKWKEKKGIFFVFFPELPQRSFYSFFPKMKREGKQKWGNCADKSRLLSAGAPRWIRPGFGKVK